MRSSACQPWNVFQTEQCRLAIHTVLTTYSGMCAAILSMSWLSTFETVWRALETVQRSLSMLGVIHGGPCWLCGMSRAFRAICQGQVGEALSHNPNAPWLFMTLLASSTYVLSLGGRIIRELPHRNGDSL